MYLIHSESNLKYEVTKNLIVSSQGNNKTFLKSRFFILREKKEEYKTIYELIKDLWQCYASNITRMFSKNYAFWQYYGSNCGRLMILFVYGKVTVLKIECIQFFGFFNSILNASCVCYPLTITIFSK